MHSGSIRHDSCHFDRLDSEAELGAHQADELRSFDAEGLGEESLAAETNYIAQRREDDTGTYVKCVESAQRLLTAIGVATPDDAPAERYVRALQAIAAQLDEMRPGDMADAIILVEEMYRELQRKLAAAPVALPVLLERAVPMFDGIERRRLRKVDLREPPTILVDDNPVRARFVEGVREAAVIPVSPRRGHAALVAAIDAQIGEAAVSYTSDAAVEVRFVSSGRTGTTVGTYLERAFPTHPVRRDIALLLIAAASSSADPQSERIRTTLGRFDSVRLRFGSFGPDVGTVSFLHEYDESGPVLLVDEALRSLPAQVFAASWELVGAHRDLWASYATALRDEVTDRFLDERGVTAADRRDVNALLDPARAARFDVLKPFILAIGLQRGIVDSVETLQNEWPAHSSSADALAEWIGSDELADLIALAVSNEDQERGTLQLLEAARLDVGAWQTARELLGLPRHHFARSRRAYQEAQAIVVATLMAAAAHAVSVDLGEARLFLTSVQGLLPSLAVLDMPRTVPTMLHELLRSALQLLQDSTHGSLGVLLSRVEEGLLAGETGAEDALRMRVTQREVDEYRIPEAARATAAQRDLGIVLDAGEQLASRLGEQLEAEGIAAVGRVSALAAGWWANRFAVLDALRQALEQIAPLTTRRLSEERAFRDPGPPGMLVGRIRELVEQTVRTQPVTAPAPRVIAVGGVTVIRAELDSDLARGSDGLIGEMLRRHIAEPLDFATARQPGPPPPRSGGRRGGGRSSRRDPRYWADHQDEREINGMLGEAFVYELFRDRLPGFDFQCWRSMNAVRYGTASEGDDTLGADFIYQDSSGLLTGRSDAPEVYLEVKSTSEEGAAPFELSAGEWNTALRLHHEGGARVYAIVRIEGVRDTPRLFRVFVDPVRLSHEGLLTIETADLRVFGG